MKKGVKIALIGIPLLAGAYLIYKQLRKPKAKPKTIPEKKEQKQEVKVKPKTTPTPINPTTSSKCEFPLEKGTYNCDTVKDLQIILNSWRYNFVNYPLVTDGDFGAKTEAALSDVTAQIAQISGVGVGHWVQIKNQQDFDNLTYSIEQELFKEDYSGVPYTQPNVDIKPNYFPNF